MNEAMSIASVTLSASDIILRLLMATLLGAIVGAEREYTHRPAGIRTHMLVALGACSVMITGEMVFSQYFPLGASPDPARMAAQVIAGVGFLGAGTILREGTAIRGLTTAASVWSVACLGVAIGAGFYIVGLVGLVLMMLTLVTMERLQKRFLQGRLVRYSFCLTVRNRKDVMEQVIQLAHQVNATLTFISVDVQPEHTEMEYNIRFRQRNFKETAYAFFAALQDNPDVIGIKIEGGA